jgi:EAL domain-containing protein (putative c-di-GMP-specific phosphodiesterase class I)
MNPRRSCLDTILEPGGLSALFQPIVEGGPRRFATRSVEGLVRGPKGSNLESASILFDYVRRKREEARVDRACIEAVCRAARDLPAPLDIAINVHAATLCTDPDLLPWLPEAARANGIATSRLTVEVVEHAPKWVDAGLRAAIDRLRRAGIRIALDDIGLGQSNYSMMLDCRPDCFKIDALLVAGARSDYYRQAVLESVAQLAAKFGASVVAEGVEDRTDLKTVASLGIGLFQGYLFSPAVPAADVPLRYLLAETMRAPDRSEASHCAEA